MLKSSGLPRVVLVYRPSEYQELVMAQGTSGQAAFFLGTRGQKLDPVARQHGALEQAMACIQAAIPPKWRRATVRRDELDRFLFEPGDLVVAVGQDGLVANVAKYLDGQRVIGVNPDRTRYDGVLARFRPERAAELIRPVMAGEIMAQQRTMVEARLRDGQRLLALNEIFVGHQSHQSARYVLRWKGQQERHSSSGLIVCTGTGGTGWARSIVGERREPLEMPGPTDQSLVFLVREAFPSRATGTALVQGRLEGDEALEVTSEMNTGGVLFGDGIESDRLSFPWGEVAELRRAERTLALV